MQFGVARQRKQVLLFHNYQTTSSSNYPASALRFQLTVFLGDESLTAPPSDLVLVLPLQMIVKSCFSAVTAGSSFFVPCTRVEPG